MKHRIRSHQLLTTLLLGAGVMSCHGSAAPPSDRPPLATVKVKTIKLIPQDLDAHEEVVGTLRAKLRSTLEAKVSGRIRRMSVDVGTRVKRGQLIAELDVREVEAQLDKAKAMLRQAEEDRRRYQALSAKGAATPAELEGVQARYRIAVASVAEARSVLSYARVSAPFDGVITHKLAEVGDMATPGRPIVELEAPDTLRFEAPVPEALSGFVGLGTRIPIRLSGQVDLIEAIVSEVAPAADPNSRTLLVKMDLPPRPDGDTPAKVALHAGQFGRALVPTGRTEILRLPREAVVRRGQLEIVFVVVQGEARLRIVKTGKVFGSSIEVVSGLDVEDEVIVTESSRLLDHNPIEVSS